MYSYILCYCGFALGDKYDLFKELRRAKYAAVLSERGIDMDPAAIPLTEDIQIDLSDVFETLHIRLDCCRVRMLSQVEFYDLY